MGSRFVMFCRMGLLCAGLTVAAPVSAQTTAPTDVVAMTQLRAKVEAIQTGPRLAGFNVVLVEGSTRAGVGTASLDVLPPAAAKALADLRDFLPYKSYKLLDSQWTRGESRIASRLQGGERGYDLEIVPAPGGLSAVMVQRFQMREAGGDLVETARTQERSIEGFLKAKLALEDLQLRRQSIDLQAEKGLISIQQAEAEKREIGARLIQAELEMGRLQTAMEEREKTRAGTGHAGGVVIDSSFRMALGETVVVGTSKIAGDRALIVLLTAVAK